MKKKNTSKKLGESFDVFDWLFFQLPGAPKDRKFLLPDEQADRAAFRLMFESDHGKRILKTFKRFARINKSRDLTNLERKEMEGILNRELACWEFKIGRGNWRGGLIAEIRKGDAKSIREILKSGANGTANLCIEPIEMCLIQYWDNGLKIGDFSLPPFAFFSAESLCDLLSVIIPNRSGLTAHALRKIMYRKLRLSPFRGKKVLPTQITKMMLALRRDTAAIGKFNAELMESVSVFRQISPVI